MTTKPICVLIDGARIEIPNALILKYDKPLPRYTSYPPAPIWSALDSTSCETAIGGIGRFPTSFYFHIPFCAEKCAFCGCNSIATTNSAIMERYVRTCILELGLVARIAKRRLAISQIHFGGGTPTSIGLDALKNILESVYQLFNVASDAEVAIELDPRVIDVAAIAVLRKTGYNRISFGIQDFDPKVTAASGRTSDPQHVERLINAARDVGIRGINVDLIYGLPAQTSVSWERTLKCVISLSPNRIALFNFAHLPRALPHQRRIDPKLLPRGLEKLKLFVDAVQYFQKEKYAFIGLDHFAKVGDPLERAYAEGRLTRNFQGYTTTADVPIIGVGSTSISEMGPLYAQNEKKLVRYLDRIESGALATDRGIKLTQDDIIRRSIIREILCLQRIDKQAFEEQWDVSFDKKFSEAEDNLTHLQDDGLVINEPKILRVTPLGRLFIRAAAAVFDATLVSKDSPYSRNV